MEHIKIKKALENNSHTKLIEIYETQNRNNKGGNATKHKA